MQTNLPNNIMHQWYLYLWDARKIKVGNTFVVPCFECGELLEEDYYKENTCCYSHILEKGNAKYRHLAGDQENVVIVHPDCHTLYGLKPKKAINQYNKKIELLKKHQL